MPASSTEAVAHIEESLKGSLQQGPAQSLDARLVSASKKILLHRIDFQPAQKSTSFQLEQLRAKYPPLNPSNCGKNKNTSSTNGTPGSTMSVKEQDGDGLPSPKVVLYPPERVRMEWPRPRHVGPGLYNAANTCFINATLQCLCYTPPLANYLQSGEHKQSCAARDFCLVCEMQKHIHRCFTGDGRPFEPTNILRKLKLISRHLHFGRQEDAHEFLRYVIDGMHKSLLNGHSKLDRYSKETTVVNQIFGGFLRSQVLCLKCKGRSNTYDPVMDISLDVKNVQTIQAALHKFVQPETLDKDNAYSCTKCSMKVPAQKRFTIHHPPNVLTIQLKRFDSYRLNCKVTRHIDFPEEFNIRQYMSLRQGEPLMYTLYGVLVHSGSSTSHGHYISYVRSSSNIWYLMNDHMVSQVSLKRVLSAEAYLLFYRRKSSAQPLSSKLVKSSSTSTISPMKKEVPKLSNGPMGQPVNDMGSPLARAQPSPVSKPLKVNGKPDKLFSSNPTPTITPRPTVIPNLSQRDKISFGIKPKETSSSKVSNEQDNQPRIVLTIKKDKKGYKSVSDSPQAKEYPDSEVKAMSNGVSPSSAAENSTGSNSSLPHKLVPYNGETSDSDSEGDTKSPKSKDQQPKEVDWGKRNGKVTSPSSEKSKSLTSFEPIMDEKLNTTTVVPGAYGPLNKNVVTGVQRRKGSLDLHSPQFHSRGLHRSNSEGGLSVMTTDSTTQHVNATSATWSVLEADLQVSPSVASASGSSNVSLNSTTEWKIHDRKRQRTGLPSSVGEGEPPGWKVTVHKKTATVVQEKVPDGNDVKENVKMPCVNETKELNITLKRHQPSSPEKSAKSADVEADNIEEPRKLAEPITESPSDSLCSPPKSDYSSTTNLISVQQTNGYLESDASPHVSCMDGFRKKKKVPTATLR